MGQDVTTDWLLGVAVGHRVAWVSHYVVGQVDCHIELLGQLHQFIEQLAKLLLPLCQLSSARVVSSEAAHQGVDNDDGVVVFEHE